MSFVIRPIAEDDIDAVLELASLTGPGMTSLPADRALLEKKIQESVNSFKVEPTKVGDEAYRFVLELVEEQKIIGIAAIRARVGGYEPFYSYEIKQAIHEAPELKVYKEVAYLELAKEHNGPSIISSLFINPEYRSQKYGKYLSQARFLFIADHRSRFTDTLIAEMRGHIDEKGQSPFWESTVRHFFDMDFTQADYLSAKDKGFIADLMPHYPIYIPLLRDRAIECIAKVHPKTEPAFKFLKSQGFKKDGHIDIFDAGPRIACAIDEIKTIKESQLTQVSRIIDDQELDNIHEALICNCSIVFRTSLGPLVVNGDNQVTIGTNLANRLDIKVGSNIRYVN